MGLPKWISFVFIFFVLLDLICFSVGEKDLEIYSLHIKSDIKLRYATTLITSRVVNRSPDKSHEAVFDVTLPNQAMISNFTMEIDGKIYPGEVKEKEAAQKQYDKAKKKGQSAGQVKARPRETNKFQVTVNVAAQGKVSFNLTYQELLERRKGLYQHVIYISPGQPVKDLKVDVAIAESRDINRLIVPPITDELLTNTLSTDKQNTEAQITRPTSKSAYIQYHPTVEKQIEVGKDTGISGLFRVFYDVERDATGGEVMVVNGYFVHFFAPQGLEPVSKNVLFILDISSSMQGTKISQLKQAMTSILKELHEGDHFGIMRFSTGAKMWFEGFLPVNSINIKKGLHYVKKTRASGWTNINDALLTGVDLLKSLKGNAAGIIVFLTDGEPTKGETNPNSILANVRNANEAAQMYSLAFGDGADYDFVKKVSAQNYGVGRKIYEDSDADLQIAGFYDDISASLLQDVQFKYVGDDVENDTVTVTSLKSFFNGSEFIVAGKLKDLSANALSTQIIANSAEGKLQLSIDSPITDIKVDESVSGLTKLEDLAKITEKIWAYLTIKQLLKQELQDITADQRKVLREQILEKSLKYNFVTPLTSMVVTKPEKSDLSELEGADVLDDVPPSGKPPSRPVSRRRGGGGGGGGGGRGGGGGDPHFEIWLKGLPEPIRFHVRSKAGEVYRIVHDKKLGLKVNVGIVRGKKIDKFGNPKTYIGEMYIQFKKQRILITPLGIIVNGKPRDWNDEMPYRSGKTVFTVSENATILTVHLTDGVELQIKRFVHVTDHVNYLNFLVSKERGLSKHAGGLIGQFVHKTARMRKKVRTANKIRAHVVLTSNHKRYRMILDLHSSKNIITQTYEAFWMVHQPSEKLLDADINTYKIKDLYS